MDRTRRAAEAKYSNYVSQSNRVLASEAGRHSGTLEKTRLECEQKLLESASFSQSEVAEFTAKVRTSLCAERRQAEEQVRQSWSVFKVFWPDKDFVRGYVTYRFTQARSTQFAERFSQLEASGSSIPVRTAAYLQISLTLGYGLDEAKSHFNKISHQSFANRVRISSTIEQAKSKLLILRAEQVSILQRRTGEIAREMETAVKDTVEQLKVSETALKKEMKAFGRA